MELDIINFNYYNNFTMEIDKSKESKYILVDFDRHHGHERTSHKIISLTANEAHKLNQSLAMNKQNKRYVRSEI